MSGEHNDFGETTVEVVITQRQAGETAVTTTRITHTGGGGMNRNAVLDVFESALRGAGYICPFDSLTVNDEEIKAP